MGGVEPNVCRFKIFVHWMTCNYIFLDVSFLAHLGLGIVVRF
jgi:hypothetical protein